MPRTRTTTSAVIGLLLGFVAASPAQGQLWYNGNPGFDMGGGASTVFSSPPYSVVRLFYEDFTVPASGWTLTGMYGNFFRHADIEPTEPTHAYWEIRTGLDPNLPVSGGGLNRGSLVHSGVSAMSWTPNGFAGIVGANMIGYLATLSGFSPLSLGSGVFWMAIAPISLQGGIDVALTDGSGATQITSGVFCNTEINNLYDPLGTTWCADGGSNWVPGASYGVEGYPTSAVPEPATVLLLANGLIILALVGYRRRRAA